MEDTAGCDMSMVLMALIKKGIDTQEDPPEEKRPLAMSRKTGQNTLLWLASYVHQVAFGR